MSSKRVTPVFSEEDSDLGAYSWSLDRHGYARRSMKVGGPGAKRRTARVFAHHDVCLRVFGRKPNWAIREVCDHIDRNKLNNTRENLRIASVRENTLNNGRAPGCVCLHGCGKWQASLHAKYIGLFDTRESARAAIDALIGGGK